jgi:hypothetical protein
LFSLFCCLKKPFRVDLNPSKSGLHATRETSSQHFAELDAPLPVANTWYGTPLIKLLYLLILPISNSTNFLQEVIAVGGIALFIFVSISLRQAVEKAWQRRATSHCKELARTCADCKSVA